MGSDLPAPAGGKAPQIVVRAVADPILGTPLERIEIIKGWVDAQGTPHAKVFPIAGGTGDAHRPRRRLLDRQDLPARAALRPLDRPRVRPHPGAPSTTRALENPTCRWSTWTCVKQGVDCTKLDPTTGALPGAAAGYEGCCVITQNGGAYAATNRFDVIEERAWTSPVWYQP